MQRERKWPGGDVCAVRWLGYPTTRHTRSPPRMRHASVLLERHPTRTNFDPLARFRTGTRSDRKGGCGALLPSESVSPGLAPKKHGDILDTPRPKNPRAPSYSGGNPREEDTPGIIRCGSQPRQHHTLRAGRTVFAHFSCSEHCESWPRVLLEVEVEGHLNKERAIRSVHEKGAGRSIEMPSAAYKTRLASPCRSFGAASRARDARYQRLRLPERGTVLHGLEGVFFLTSYASGADAGGVLP